MSLKKSALKGTIWSAINVGGSQVSSLLIFFLLARQLNPEDFGLIALSNLIINFMQVFIEQGVSQAIIQAKDIQQKDLNTAFWLNIFLTILLIFICIVSAQRISIVFEEPSLELIIKVLSVVLIFNALSSVQIGVLNRNLEFRSLALRDLLSVTIGGIAGLLTALLGYGVWSLVVQQIVKGCTSALVLWSVSEWRPNLKLSVQGYKELLSFSANVTGVSIFYFVNRRSDDLLIGYFLGASALGYYSIAYKVLIMMHQLIGKVSSLVGLPILSRLQDDPQKFSSVYSLATRIKGMLLIPIFIGISLMSAEIIYILFGQQWLISSPILTALALSGIPIGISMTGIALTSMGKPDWNLKFVAFSSLVNIVGFLIAVNWGILAVAISFTIRYYLLLPLELFLVRKIIHLDIKKYLSQFIPIIAASFVMSISIFSIKTLLLPDNTSYLIVTLVCTFMALSSYIVSLWFMASNMLKEVVSIVST